MQSKTRGLAISSWVVIIWYLSLRALTDCTQRCGLGSGHFKPDWKWPDPGFPGFWGLAIS